MKYSELVEMWNEEFSEGLGDWNSISEERKIEFAFDEGRRSGFVEIAELATKLSEEDRIR